MEEERLDEANRALQRAHRLLPGSPLLRAHRLLVVANSLAYPDAAMSRTEAEGELDRTYEDLQREPAGAVVYLGFMMASLAAFLVTFFRGEDASVHRQRADWAAEEGAKRPSIVSQDLGQHIEAAGLLIRLLTAKPDAFMSIIEVAARDTLRSIGVERPLDRGTPQSTGASLIRGVMLNAARWLPPSPALDLAA